MNSKLIGEFYTALKGKNIPPVSLHGMVPKDKLQLLFIEYFFAVVMEEEHCKLIKCIQNDNSIHTCKHHKLGCPSCHGNVNNRARCSFFCILHPVLCLKGKCIQISI